MTKEIDTTDLELESLMAELETQNDAIMAKQAAPEPVKQPEPVVDLTRAIIIHNAAANKVRKGTVGDLKEGDQEVERAEGVALAKQYKAAEEAKVVQPWDDEPAAPAPSTVPDFVKKLVKVKPAPEVFEDVPDLEAAALERAAKEEPDAHCITEPDGSCVGGLLVSVKPCMHDAPTAEEEKPTSSLKHYVDADQFIKDTRVSDVNLDKCMIEQNSLRAYYGTQAALAEAQASRLKARFEVIEASLYDKHRKEFAAAGEKATVQMVESAAKMDARWLSSKNLVIESETIAAISKSMVESLKDRRDMIIQLGADRRDEGKGAVRILAEQQERQELRERALKAGTRHA